ncbi:MAG: hypothetical protein LIP77_12405 [Planctomycetes bacterium]|nr:hypothetical protein [Planctomycetota bacterium]
MPDLSAFPPPDRRNWLRRLDGRWKLAGLLAACLTGQYLPLTWLPLWLALLVAGLGAGVRRAEAERIMLRAGVRFLLFWFAVQVVNDRLWGADWSAAVQTAVPPMGRLLALVLAGILFAGSSSPMETGRAVAWFLRPLLGKRAWQPALVVALTAWFLPLTLRLASDVGASIRARGLRLGWWRRLLVTTGTAIRVLEHTAREVAVGLASRRLDDYRSWEQ